MLHGAVPYKIPSHTIGVVSTVPNDPAVSYDHARPSRPAFVVSICFNGL